MVWDARFAASDWRTLPLSKVIRKRSPPSSAPDSLSQPSQRYCPQPKPSLSLACARLCCAALLAAEGGGCRRVFGGEARSISVLLSRLELLPAAASTHSCLRAPVSPKTRRTARRGFVSPVPPAAHSPYSRCLPLLLLLFFQRSSQQQQPLWRSPLHLAQPCLFSKKPRPPAHTATRQTHSCILRSTTLCLLRAPSH